MRGRRQLPKTSFTRFSELTDFTISRQFSDPTFWSGIRAMQQQWLLQRKRNTTLPVAKVGSPLAAINNSLSQVPEINVPALKNPERLNSLFNASRSINSFFGQLNNMVEKVAVNLAVPLVNISQISERLAHPTSALQQVIANIPNVQNFDNFWANLRPFFESFENLLEDAETGREVLRSSEFGFADHLWTIFYVRGFAHIDPQTRSATVTNKLAAWTRSEQFVEQFRYGASESKLLAKRWRIIESAIEAHSLRNYDLAVPALLAQIEGVLVDLMFIKDLVKKEGNKFYLANEYGEFKTDKRGRRLAPITLNPAVTHAKLSEHSNLAAASEFVADTLVQRRNAVLHGHDLTYGKAKFSVQALLILKVLADAVTRLES